MRLWNCCCCSAATALYFASHPVLFVCIYICSAPCINQPVPWNRWLVVRRINWKVSSCNLRNMFSTKPTSINRSPPRLLLLHSTDIKHMQAPEERFLYKVLFFFSIEPSISFCIPSPLSSVSCVDPSNPLFPGQSKCNNFPLSHVACGASLPFAWLAGWLARGAITAGEVLP